MQDLSNQYLIEKREPQPASSSSSRAQAHWAAAACYVRTTWVRCRWFMRSGFQLWLLFVPNIIHAHTIFDVHHHLLLFWRSPDSALNCWYSHSAHVSEHKCNRLEIGRKQFLKSEWMFYVSGCLACLRANNSGVLAACDVNTSFKRIHFC